MQSTLKLSLLLLALSLPTRLHADQSAPEPVLSVRVRLAATKPTIRALSAAARTKLLDRLRAVVGLDLGDPRALARAGIDASRDLVFSLGARDLERVHGAARMTFSRLRDRYLKFVRKRGPSPLPLGWFELRVPTTSATLADAALATAIRKASGDRASRKAMGSGASKRARTVWMPVGGFVVGAWHTPGYLNLRIMLQEEARFDRGIPSLAALSASTRTRMKRCGYLDGDVGLYVDLNGWARYGQMVSLVQAFSGVAGIDPTKKNRFFAMGARESRAFEGLRQAGRALFSHFCESEAGSRWGLSASAIRVLVRAKSAGGKLERAVLRRLSSRMKVPRSKLPRWLRDGGALAGSFARMFLWPVLLSDKPDGKRTAALDRALLDRRFEVDRSRRHLSISAAVARHVLPTLQAR